MSSSTRPFAATCLGLVFSAILAGRIAQAEVPTPCQHALVKDVHWETASIRTKLAIANYASSEFRSNVERELGGSALVKGIPIGGQARERTDQSSVAVNDYRLASEGALLTEHSEQVLSANALEAYKACLKQKTTGLTAFVQSRVGDVVVIGAHFGDLAESTQERRLRLSACPSSGCTDESVAKILRVSTPADRESFGRPFIGTSSDRTLSLAIPGNEVVTVTVHAEPGGGGRTMLVGPVPVLEHYEIVERQAIDVQVCSVHSGDSVVYVPPKPCTYVAPDGWAIERAEVSHRTEQCRGCRAPNARVSDRKDYANAIAFLLHFGANDTPSNAKGFVTGSIVRHAWVPVRE